jgi:hypothetical protein
MKRAFALFVALWLLALPSIARAHDFEPGVLVLVETAPHRFDVAWSQPIDSRGAPSGVELELPDTCRYADATLDCGNAPLAGRIRFRGMHSSRTQVIVIVEWAGGERLERLVTGASPELEVGAGPGRDAGAWLLLGVEHIATGFDHLAFVIGLLLVVGLDRRLIATITAFTLAHSLTLALSVSGLLQLPSRAVEATIAASVVLVAREGMGDRETAVRRFPWLVAAIFGLVHGLGFASALRDLGLPRGATGFALLFFNLGVELGQLAIVALCFVLVRVGARAAERLPVRTMLSYVLGSAGAFWCIERAAAIVTTR